MTDYKAMFNLEGKRAIIVGGAGGIGGAIAEAFAQSGVKVGIVGRNADKLNKKAAQIKADYKADVACFSADCSQEADVIKLADEVKAAFGGVDILVNSQGLNRKFSALDHPVADWDEMFAINVRSVMLTCEYFGRMMKEQEYGRIINISSIGGVRAKNNDISCGYGATKGAVNSYTLNIAGGWIKFGVTVNCIAPIITETEMMLPIFEKNPNLVPETCARVPAGRLGKPEDCAGLAMYLASDAASFVTGSVFYPDGGLCTQQ